MFIYCCCGGCSEGRPKSRSLYSSIKCIIVRKWNWLRSSQSRILTPNVIIRTLKLIVARSTVWWHSIVGNGQSKLQPFIV